MTKNLSSKPGYRGGNPKVDKKLQPNSNATNHHSQNETVVANSAALVITVQKASIDLKMLTPEQRRLANLMNDKVDVSEIERKINKIMELTGATKDKAIVALHDCANELDKAIDMILEGDSINESEWKSQARKKKPKAKELEQNANLGKNLNNDAKKGGQKAGGRQIRSKQQQTNNPSSDKPNKFERAGNKKDRDQQPHWKQSKELNNSVNEESTTQLMNNKDVVEQVEDKSDDWPDESTSTNDNSNNSGTQRNRVVNNNNESQFKPSTHKYHQDRDQRRPPPGSRSNYNNRSFGTSGDRNLNDRRNDRGQGDRMMDRRSYQNKSYAKKPGNFTNSIDTWSNYTVTDNNPTTNNDYAQMTVGNWSDVVSSTTSTTANVQQNKNEDLNENNEWTEPSTNTNLVDQLKNNNQTSNKTDHHNLPKMPNLASIVSGVKPQPPQSVQQQTVHHKSPNIKQQQSINLSNSNNHQLSASQQHPLTKSPQQQRQPPQQASSSTTNQPNKIDLAALLKSSSTNQTAQPQQPQSTNEQQMNKLIRGNIQQQQQQQQRSSNSDTNTYGAVLLQRLQQGANNLSDYVNSYSTSNSQQLSNQNKNLVHHIPSTSNYNSQNNSTSALFDNQSHHNQLQQQNTSLEHQKSLIEKKRRQTKIPETAVEMPSSDHISSLNVQFGALDFVGSATNTAAADSYLNDHQSSNNEKSANNSTPANSLLSTVRGNDNKQNISDHHQQMQDNILHAAADNRNKQQAQQQQTGYQQHINNSYKNENTSSIYPSNLQGYQSSYSVNNYGSQNHQQQNNQSMSSSNQQKINLKDLDTSSSTANSDKQNPANNANSNSLGNLVNNTTVTTNVLKNSLTATGKTQANMQQQLNVPPNVAPLLGTPQYIMSQPGLSTAFYPVYDMPMGPATDHSFRGYNQNTGPQDVKYSRSDNQDGQTNHPVNPGVGQSNQGAPVTQTPNHQIFSHMPPYFFYTGMMTQGLQGLYQTPAPIFPVQPNPGPPNTGNPQAPHANSNHSTAGFGGPKSAQNQAAPYSTASAYSNSTSYDPMTGQLTNQGAQDYNKPQNYTSGPNNSNQQSVKQMSNTGSNDLVNNNMYTKSHAQLTKNFDKSGTFQSGTPPPFGIAALGYNPNQFIPMMQPQSNPSMLHHSLQGDGSNHNQNNSGVGGNNQRGGSLSQKNTTSNANKYYNWS